jgi:hypothetical protein
VKVLQSLRRILEPEENFGSQSGARHRRGDCCPTECGDDGVTEAPSKTEIKYRRNYIGCALEEQVGVNYIRSDMEVYRECRV